MAEVDVIRDGFARILSYHHSIYAHVNKGGILFSIEPANKRSGSTYINLQRTVVRSCRLEWTLMGGADV